MSENIYYQCPECEFIIFNLTKIIMPLCPNCFFKEHKSIEMIKIENKNNKKEKKNMEDKNKNLFLTALEEEDNYTKTENFALTFRSTKSSLLDFFAMGGALRQRDEADIVRLFIKAFNEDSLLALKCLFYFRDIREGQGERRTFRTILNFLGTNYPNLVLKNFEIIPEFGRWDDLYALVDTKIERQMFEYLYNQLQADNEAEFPSLLAKWIKSENTSSANTRELARRTRKAFGMSHKEYRVILSFLRSKLNIVERQMCAKQWKEIDYSKIPSKAGLIYNKAFRKHDEEGYQKFLDEVKEGKTKINVSTLYPYDILRKVVNDPQSVEECDLMWKNQKNWIEGSEEKTLVVCDTSGSMFPGFTVRKSVDPIYVAVSLAMYFGERNKGVFRDKFITFSENPRLQSIVRGNIFEKWASLSKADWDGNTNLQKVFDLILYTARKHKVPQYEMPDKIYIISDMEFDRCCIFEEGYGNRYGRHSDITNFEGIKRLYEKAGYKLPALVFWNVESRHDNVPIKKDERGVILCSGSSPSTFKHLMKSIDDLTPFNLMLDVLNSPRYDSVKL